MTDHDLERLEQLIKDAKTERNSYRMALTEIANLTPERALEAIGIARRALDGGGR